jgi:hypothetical protein
MLTPAAYADRAYADARLRLGDIPEDAPVLSVW